MRTQVVLDFNLGCTTTEFRELSKDLKTNLQKLISAMEPELADFDRYLIKERDMDPMMNMEQRIVREYLGWLLSRAPRAEAGNG